MSTDESLISEASQEAAPVRAGDTAPDGTVVSEAAAKALSPAPADPLADIPQPFHVRKEDGTVDWESIARKAAKSHQHAQLKLSQRKNTAPEEYVKDGIVPDGIKVGDDMFDDFKRMDLSQDQAKAVPELVASKIVPELTKKEAALEKERLAMKWDTKIDTPEFSERMQRVSKWAVDSLGADVAKQIARTAEGFIGLEMQMKAAVDRERVTTPAMQPTPKGKPQLKSELQSLVASDAYRAGDPYTVQRALQLADQVAAMT